MKTATRYEHPPGKEIIKILPKLFILRDPDQQDPGDANSCVNCISQE